MVQNKLFNRSCFADQCVSTAFILHQSNEISNRSHFNLKKSYPRPDFVNVGPGPPKGFGPIS